MSRHLVFRFFIPVVSLFTSSLFAQTDLDFAYLGVHTSRLDQAISHQLGLPDGVHLRVERVVPGSPAEVGGVKLYDVLLKFEDQLLINPEQLKTLVRMRNPGERITLSVLRQSKPVSLSVELMEVPEEFRQSEDQNWMNEPDPFGMDRFFGPNDRIRDFFRRRSFDFPDLGDFHKHPFFSNPRLDDPSNAPFSSGPGTVDDPLHGGGADVQSYTYSTSTQQITVHDDQGSLQWTEKDGVRFLRATDLQGRVVFDGPITTEEDRQKLPKEVGERLWAIQQSGQIPLN